MNSANIIRKFNMEYGTFLGIAWTVVFYAYIYGFLWGSSLLTLVAMLGLLGLAVFPVYLSMRLRNISSQIGYKPHFLYWMLITLSMFMYACLICGVAEFIYFRMLDHGNLFEAISRAIHEMNLKDIYREAGMADQYRQIEESLKAFGDLSATDISLALFNMNFTVSVILTLPITLISSVIYSRKK